MGQEPSDKGQQGSAGLPSANGNSSGTSGLLRQRPQNERLLMVLGWRECQFTSVVFASNGLWLAAGATDGLSYVFDVQTFTLLRWLESHSGVVTSVAFSPDGMMIGRTAYEKSCLLAGVNVAIWGNAPLPLNRHDVVAALEAYIEPNLAHGG